MKSSQQRNQIAETASVVHDVSLLVVAFYAPIFWGGVAIPETHAPGTFSASLGLALMSAVVAIATLAALVARWALARRPALLPSAINLPAVALLAVSAVSTLFSVSPHASLLELSRLLTGVLIFWLVASRRSLPVTPSNLVGALFGCSVVLVGLIPLPGDPGLALRIFSVAALGAAVAYVVSAREVSPIRWWTGALIASAGLTVALYGLREKMAVLQDPDLQDATWQIFSTFFNPNPLGGFIAMVFPLALTAALTATVLWRWLLWVFCSSMLATAIIPTYSKGAQLALLVSMLCYAIFMGCQTARGRRILRRAFAVAAIIAVGAAVVGWRAEPVRARLSAAVGTQSASNMFRLLTWKGTVRLAAAHPLIGVGPGSFKYAYPKYAITGYVEAAHQNYLQMFAELGVVGGSSFLWLMGAAVFTGLRARRAAADFEDRAWATAGLCSIIAMLVHSFLDYDWYVGAIAVTFWLVAGMLADRARPAAAEAPAPAAGDSSARAGRSRAAARPTPTDDPALHLLAWPGTAPGRTLATVAVFAILYTMVSLPVRNARAQHYMELGDAAYFDAQQAFLEHDTATAVQNMNAALVFYRKARDLDPGWSRAWEKYGIVQGGQGQVDAGVDSIQKAIQHEPTNHMPIKSLGSLYLVAGRYEEAAECYREALETFPNNTKIWKALAETYQRMGDGASAFRAYQRMVEIEKSPYNEYRALESVDVDDTYAYAHYHLGRAALLAYDRGTRADGLQAALAEYEAALEIIAAYHATAEETDNMFLLLRRTRPHRGIEIRDLEARVHWRVADVYERLGDADRAAQERTLASSLIPGIGKAAAIEDGEQAQ